MRRGIEEGDLAGLLERCRKNDARAWRELVDRFQAFVYSIPRRMGLSEDDSADVFQNTFVALHRSLDRIEAAAALPKWIGTTAAREALRMLRLGAARASTSLNDEGRGLDEIVASEDDSAERAAVLACESRLLRLAISKLGGRCSELLAALYLDGERPYQDVSTALGMPIGAIGPTRARCLEKLRQKLDEGGFFA